MGDVGTKSPYLPVFLDQEEAATPSDVGTQSLDESAASDLAFSSETFMGYEARVQDLRILKPYATDLKSRLGDSLYVIQCRLPLSLNSVPNEWKTKATTLLWKVKGPGFLGYVTDRDFSTFYFRSKTEADEFVGKMNGAGTSTSADDLLKQRDRLKKILG